MGCCNTCSPYQIKRYTNAEVKLFFSAIVIVSLVRSMTAIFSSGGMIQYFYDNSEDKPRDDFGVTNPSALHSKQQCLRLGFENDMDKLLSNYKQVFVIMPAKAAGTTFKVFTKTCMKGKNSSFQDETNIINRPRVLKEALRGAAEMPSLISSHVYNSKSFVSLVKHATEQSLIIYSHRKETERLRSAIIHVAMRKCIQAHVYETKKCELEENYVLQFITERESEIGFSASSILTCETYESIEDNAPDLVFMNYKQADQMQKLLAKHHCSEEEFIHRNSGSQKLPIFVRLENNDISNSTVDLNDWLDGKMELIELSLNMKKDISCQAKTKKIQRDLLSCPDETLLVSSSDFFDSA
jgi:hypothetical protein